MYHPRELLAFFFRPKPYIQHFVQWSGLNWMSHQNFKHNPFGGIV